MRKRSTVAIAVLLVLSPALAAAQGTVKGRNLEQRTLAQPTPPSTPAPSPPVIQQMEFYDGNFPRPAGDASPVSSATWIRAGAGDLLAVRGTALDGLSSIFLRGTPANVPITAVQGNASQFTFRMPAGLAANSQWTLVVTKGTLASSSGKTIFNMPGRTRKLYGIDRADTLVRAGGTLHVHGVGFGNSPGTSRDDHVYGAYFGTGAPGSPTNQIVATPMGADEYSLALMVNGNCNQSGPLILAARKPDGTDELIQTTFIKVRCWK